MRVTRWTQHAILKRSLCIWSLVPPHPPPHFCTPVPLPSVSLCPHPAASRNCFHLAASDLHLSTSIWEEINMGVLFFIMHLVSLAHTAIVIEWYVLSIYIYVFSIPFIWTAVVIHRQIRSVFEASSHPSQTNWMWTVSASLCYIGVEFICTARTQWMTV